MPEKIEEQDDRPEKIITDSSSAATAIITPTGCRATKDTVFFVSSAVFFAALRVFSAVFAAAAAGSGVGRGDLWVILQRLLVQVVDVGLFCRPFRFRRCPVGFELVAAVALPDFPRPVFQALFRCFLGFVRTLHAGIVLFNGMYLVVDENTRLLCGAGKGAVLFLKAGGLVVFFKAQAGLALARGFVKGAFPHQLLFFGDSRPCSVQTVGGLVGFLNVLTKLRRRPFLVGELQT